MNDPDPNDDARNSYDEEPGADPLEHRRTFAIRTFCELILAPVEPDSNCTSHSCEDGDEYACILVSSRERSTFDLIHAASKAMDAGLDGGGETVDPILDRP